jgi:hypothetical protein
MDREVLCIWLLLYRQLVRDEQRDVDTGHFSVTTARNDVDCVPLDWKPSFLSTFNPCRPMRNRK